MKLFGKKKHSTFSVEDLAGLILTEKSLMNMLQGRFKQKIRHITTKQDSFILHFDPSEDINSMIMGQEDMVNFFRKYFNRTIIQVTTFDGGHEQYLVRFEE